jgi:hypothetical protein
MLSPTIQVRNVDCVNIFDRLGILEIDEQAQYIFYLKDECTS